MTVEHIDLRPCTHVESDELQAWAIVRIHNLPGCDYRGEQIAMNFLSCALCAGRALGAMFVGDCERGLTREAIESWSNAISLVLERADLKPSHELAAALVELGAVMAQKLGRR